MYTSPHLGCVFGGGGRVKENMVKMQLINTIGYTQSAPPHPPTATTHTLSCGIRARAALAFVTISKGAQATPLSARGSGGGGGSGSYPMGSPPYTRAERSRRVTSHILALTYGLRRVGVEG